MLETISSKSIEPIIGMVFGSSSTDNEDKRFISYGYFPKNSIYPRGIYFPFEITSFVEDMSINFQTETFGERETIPEEMLEHDIFVKMPPKNKYIIKAKIARVRKAEPRIVIPEYPYTGI